VQLVDKAVMNFVAVGEDIAAENPAFQVRKFECESPTPLLHKTTDFSPTRLQAK